MGKTRKPDYGPAMTAMQKPPVASFAYPWGRGSYDQGRNTYQFLEDPTAQDDRVMAEGIRRDLFKSLGLVGGGDDPYAKTLMNESLRIAQPQLENALIQRGLGGSSVYREALSDLINKAGTSSILESRNARLRDLQGLSSYLLPQQEWATNIMNNLANLGLQEEQFGLARGGALANLESERANRTNQSKKEMFQNLTTLALLASIPFAGGATAPAAIGSATMGGSGGFFGSRLRPQQSNLRVLNLN